MKPSRGRIHVERFWYKIDESFELHGAFLADPTHKHSQYFSSRAMKLDDVRHEPLLILLGEPGIGKSVEIERAGNESLDVPAVVVKLEEFSSDISLEKHLESHSDIQNWVSGDYVLELFFDSFDECRIQSREHVLPRIIRTLPVDRLRIRLGCRNGAYSSSVGTRIADDLSSATGSKVTPTTLKLAPLRLIDVTRIAKAAGIDHEKFLEELDRLGVGFLASIPTTLYLLIGGYLRDGKLGDKIVDVYRRGIHSLLEEHSEDRDNRAKVDLEQRIRVAERAAAVAVLSARIHFWTDSDTTVPDSEFVSLSSLTGDSVKGAASVRRQLVLDTLSSGVFKPHGHQSVEWSHWTFAEFLCSEYLCKNIPNVQGVASVLIEPTSQRVYPQLKETAAWVASMRPEFARMLLATDPLTLLSSDVANEDTTFKKDLTLGYLSAIEKGIVTRDIGMHYLLGRLNVPDLSDLLKPIISDRGRKSDVRAEAIDIAESCSLIELSQILANIALETADEYYVRTHAAHAVAKIGDEESKKRLLTLSQDSAIHDPDDQLRGESLKACWPKLMSVDEFLKAMRPPNNSHLLGSFYGFLGWDFPDTIRDEHTVPFLTWLVSRDSEKRGRGSREYFEKSVMVYAWNHMDLDGVLPLVARLVHRRLRRYEEPFEWDDVYLLEETFNDDVQKRRSLFTEVVRLEAKKKERRNRDVYSLTKLLNTSDLEWLLQHAKQREGLEQNILLQASAELIDNQNLPYDLLHRAVDDFPDRNERFLQLVGPIPIDSEMANHMRKWQREREEFRLQRRQIKKPEDPTQNIFDLLTKAVKGEAEFWVAQHVLAVDDSSRVSDGAHSSVEFEQLPRWRMVQEHFESHWLRLCEVHLKTFEPLCDPAETNTIYHPDVCAMRCFRYLRKHAPSVVDSNAESLYKKWAHSLIFCSCHIYRDYSQEDLDLVQDCWTFAPNESREAFLKIAKSESLLQDFASCIKIIKLIDDPMLLDGLLDLVRSEDARHPWSREVLEFLMQRDHEETLKHIQSILSSGDHSESARAALRALLLTGDLQDWKTIKKSLASGEDWLREAIRDLAIGPREVWIKKHLERFGITATGQLFEMMCQVYPPKDDPDFKGGFVPPDVAAAHKRDEIPSLLADIGTLEAVAELERLQKALPEATNLSYTLVRARNNLRRNSLHRPLPAEVLYIEVESAGVPITSQDVLLGVVIDALNYVQNADLAAGTNHKYWNGLDHKYENPISDLVAESLRLVLVTQGVSVQREEEVDGSHPPDMTFKHIRSLDNGEMAEIVVTLEAKGDWDVPSLKKAIKEQLSEKYLSAGVRERGVLLVYWSKPVNENLVRFLEAEAIKYSKNGLIIKYLDFDIRN